MTYSEFVTKWNLKPCDRDEVYGDQCVDLAHQYAVEVVGHDIPPVAGAKDEWGYTSIEGYTKVSNSATNVPVQGDIIIWSHVIGAYGHIAIFDHGDAVSFISFDQNWPLNSKCHLQAHDYFGVLGWFHPQPPVPLPPVIINPPMPSDPGYIIDPREINDIYRALCGEEVSSGELAYRISQHINRYDLIREILNGDERAKALWRSTNIADLTIKQLAEAIVNKS